jgi:hypothetical protein
MKTISLLTSFAVNVPDDVNPQDCFLNIPNLDKIQILKTSSNIKTGFEFIPGAEIVDYDTINCELVEK